MLKTVVQRYKSPDTKFGKFLRTYVAGFFAIITALGGANEVIAVFPPEIVPKWLKVTILICAVISYVWGKMTKGEQK